jgi:hypothetical protein
VYVHDENLSDVLVARCIANGREASVLIGSRLCPARIIAC